MKPSAGPLPPSHHLHRARPVVGIERHVGGARVDAGTRKRERDDPP